jgi:hypothetical protein
MLFHGQVARVVRQLREAEFHCAEKEFLRLARLGARKSTRKSDVFVGKLGNSHVFAGSLTINIYPLVF